MTNEHAYNKRRIKSDSHTLLYSPRKAAQIKRQNNENVAIQNTLLHCQ